MDAVNRFNHTSWVTVVTPTDVLCRFFIVVIEFCGGVFVLFLCFMEFSVGVMAFVVGLSPIYFVFLFTHNLQITYCGVLFGGAIGILCALHKAEARIPRV